MEENQFMQRAMELARNGAGRVSPNPLVGAVLVKDGRIIGEGFHQQYGEKHAEVNAIENSTVPVKGATLYCNLEPCCFQSPLKKQPPCTDRIIQEKISRVVIANLDPNPQVSGKGIKILSDGGIEVTTGVCHEEGALLNEVFFHNMAFNKPFVHLKLAQSLDGRIATSSFKSKWITDVSARESVQKLRRDYDAILVGSNTVKQDNPSLTLRGLEGSQPVRVILDSQLSTPMDSEIYAPHSTSRTIVFTTTTGSSRKKEILRSRGVLVVESPMNDAKKIPLDLVLSQLYERDIGSILVEGGSAVQTSFIREKLFDKVSIYIAPIVIGKGIEAVGDLGTDSIEEALRLRRTSITTIGDQVLMQGYRENRQWQEEEGYVYRNN